MNKQNLPPEYRMGPLIERDVVFEYRLQDKETGETIFLDVSVRQMENNVFENKYNVISRGQFVGEWDANNKPIYEGHTLKVGRHCKLINVLLGIDGEHQIIANPNQTCTITWSIYQNRFICSTGSGSISHKFWKLMYNVGSRCDD